MAEFAPCADAASLRASSASSPTSQCAPSNEASLAGLPFEARCSRARAKIETVNRANAKFVHRSEEVTRALTQPRSTLWELLAEARRPGLGMALTNVNVVGGLTMVDEDMELEGATGDEEFTNSRSAREIRANREEKWIAMNELYSRVDRYNGDLKAVRAAVAQGRRKKALVDEDVRIASDKIAEDVPLFQFVDHTNTPFGQTLLKEWVRAAGGFLCGEEADIEARHEAVCFFCNHLELTQHLCDDLREVSEKSKKDSVDLQQTTTEINEEDTSDPTTADVWKLLKLLETFELCLLRVIERFTALKKTNVALPKRLEILIHSATTSSANEGQEAFSRLTGLLKSIGDIRGSVKYHKRHNDGGEYVPKEGVDLQYGLLQEKISTVKDLLVEELRSLVDRMNSTALEPFPGELKFVPALDEADAPGKTSLEIEGLDSKGLKTFIRKNHPYVWVTSYVKDRVRLRTARVKELMDNPGGFNSLKKKREEVTKRFLKRLFVNFREKQEDFFMAIRFIAELDALLSLAVATHGLTVQEIIVEEEGLDEVHAQEALERCPAQVQGSPSRAVRGLRAVQLDLTKDQKLQKAKRLLASCVEELTGAQSAASFDTFQDRRGIKLRHGDDVTIHATVDTRWNGKTGKLLRLRQPGQTTQPLQSEQEGLRWRVKLKDGSVLAALPDVLVKEGSGRLSTRSMPASVPHWWDTM